MTTAEGIDDEEYVDPTEAAVLAILLTVFPAPITREEVRRRVLGTTSTAFAPRDDVNNAMHMLITHGAANDSGELLIASQAAVYTARTYR